MHLKFSALFSFQIKMMIFEKVFFYYYSTNSGDNILTMLSYVFFMIDIHESFVKIIENDIFLVDLYNNYSKIVKGNLIWATNIERLCFIVIIIICGFKKDIDWNCDNQKNDNKFQTQECWIIYYETRSTHNDKSFWYFQ